MRAIFSATVVTTLALVLLYSINRPLPDSLHFFNMADTSSSQSSATLDPHISKSDLTLELTVKEPQTSPPTLLATVTNLHESSTVTLLTWDTPFDTHCLQLGLFTITDLASSISLPSPGLKLNRKVPPPPDAFLELRPRHAITREIELSGLGAELEKGRTYEVKARGKAKAVWLAAVSEVGVGELQKMGGGTGVLGWDFESNAVTVEA